VDIALGLLEVSWHPTPNTPLPESI